MGMIKKGSTAAAPVATTIAPAVVQSTAPANTDNGTAAAVSRLKKKTEGIVGSPAAGQKQKAYEDPSARGKTRCAAFAAALASNYIPGLPVKNIDEYLENVKKAADVMVAYTFEEIEQK